MCPQCREVVCLPQFSRPDTSPTSDKTPAKAIAGRNFAQQTGGSFVTEQANKEQTKTSIGYVALLDKSFDLPDSGTGSESTSHLHPGLPTDDQAAEQ